MQIKKIVTFTLTTILFTASINSLQAAETSPAEALVNQLLAINDPDKTAQTILDVQGKLAACQQQESADCSYYTEILSLLSPEEAQ